MEEFRVSIGELTSSSVSWGEYAGGARYRVPGLADDNALLVKVRNRLYSWCHRNGYRARTSCEKSGDFTFRIVEP